MHRIPTTRSDWELYNRPGVELAAKELTSALIRTMTAVKETFAKGGYEPGPLALLLEMSKQAQTILYPVLKQFREFGALDTEPRAVARDALRWFAEEEFGCKRNLLVDL